MAPPTEDEDEQVDRRRRRFLASLGLLGVAGVGGVAGYRRITARPPPSNDLVSGIPADELRELAHRYAPDLHFDRREQWFPTDAMRYSTERDGETIVDGVHALRAYTSDAREAGRPPAPTVYWHAHDASEDVFAIQYWMYSVFDQFTVNFHWHDWELLQVFVDAETREPVLISASAHSRSSPNNEFMEPDLTDGRRPIVLAELGSHSSGIDLNEQVPSFERLPDGSIRSDITNDWVRVTDRIDTPFAYGLPRDEGARLPMVLPELAGHPLYQHPDLEDVLDREDFLDEAVTVRGWRDLARPPRELPVREPGLVMAHADSETVPDVTYDLRPMRAVEGVAAFTGPQLSFEFPIPGFAEDAYADHITSVGIPWEQPRYTDPLSDVTDVQHRLAVQGIEAPELLDRVIGRFTMLASGPAGAVDALTDAELEAYGEIVAVSRQPVPVELAVRLASQEPAMAITNDGAVGFVRVEAGEHLLGAVGPEIAPVAVRFAHEGGTVRFGADGRLSVVAAEDAAWIRGDGRNATAIAHVRVIEDFAGPVYAGEPVEDDRFAVAVHRDGRYIVEVHDRDGARGAYRVIPGERDEVIIEEVETGKRSLVRVLASYLASTVELALDLCEGCDRLETHVGPRGAGFDDGDRIRASPRRDVVAMEDRVAVRLETAGMPDLDPDTALETMAVTFRLVEGEGAPAVFDDTDPGIASFAADTGGYVTIDMAASEVRFAPGQTWSVSVSIPGEAPVEPASIEIVGRHVELATEEPPFRMTPTEDAIVAGTSTMAPGTGLTVRVRTEDRLFRSQEAAIDDAGRFDVTFDLSDREVGEPVGIEIWEGDRRYLLEDGVLAEEPSEASSEPMGEAYVADGWDVIRPIAEATRIAGGLRTDTDPTTGSEVNAELDEVRTFVEVSLDELRDAESGGFDRPGARMLVRRLEEVIERVDDAMETPV